MAPRSQEKPSSSIGSTCVTLPLEFVPHLGSPCLKGNTQQGVSSPGASSFGVAASPARTCSMASRLFSFSKTCLHANRSKHLRWAPVQEDPERYVSVSGMSAGMAVRSNHETNNSRRFCRHCHLPDDLLPQLRGQGLNMEIRCDSHRTGFIRQIISPILKLDDWQSIMYSSGDESCILKARKNDESIQRGSRVAVAQR